MGLVAGVGLPAIINTGAQKPTWPKNHLNLALEMMVDWPNQVLNLDYMTILIICPLFYIPMSLILSTKATYPLPFSTFESMILLFTRWGMFFPWGIRFIQRGIAPVVERKSTSV